MGSKHGTKPSIPKAQEILMQKKFAKRSYIMETIKEQFRFWISMIETQTLTQETLMGKIW
jgi:hypothetical protein